MNEVSISEFKAKCIGLIEQVCKTKQPLRVVRHGKPLVEIVPTSEKVDRMEWIGSMKDSVEILGDIISPATDEDDWEVLRD
jgi:prevent-host-death family protein